MSSSHHKEHTYGFWTLTALVVGTMVGSGIFFIPAALASLGPISIFGWTVTSIGAIALAYLFARLAMLSENPGAPYTYVTQAFGPLAGFMVSWGYWCMSWTSIAAIPLAFVGYLSYFYPVLLENRDFTMYAALGVVWFATFINLLGRHVGSGVQLLTSVLKSIPLIAVSVIGLGYVQMENFTPFNISGLPAFDAINASAAMTLFAFIGLESATVPSGNVKGGPATVAKATMFGTLFGAVLYVLSTYSLLGIVPAVQLAQSNAPFVDAAKVMFAPSVIALIGYAVLVSSFGGLNGWVILQGQIPVNLAKAGMFPKFFGRAGHTGATLFGLLLATITIMFLLKVYPTVPARELFAHVILSGAALTLVAYLGAALASFKLLRGRSDTNGAPALSWMTKTAAVIGSVYAVWAIYGVQPLSLAVCGVLYAIGVPVYYTTVRVYQQKQAQHAVAEKLAA